MWKTAENSNFQKNSCCKREWVKMPFNSSLPYIRCFGLYTERGKVMTMYNERKLLVIFFKKFAL